VRITINRHCRLR